MAKRIPAPTATSWVRDVDRRMWIASGVLHVLLPVSWLLLPEAETAARTVPEPIEISFQRRPQPEPKPTPEPLRPTPPAARPISVTRPPTLPARPAVIPVIAAPSPAIARPVESPQPARLVQGAGFGESPRSPTVVAAGPARERVITAGFEEGESAATLQAATRRAVSVGSAGFDSTTARRETSTAAGEIRAGGFGDPAGGEAVSPPRTRARARPEPDSAATVEIVTKPRPIYTDEARRLRIEGDVVLEVVFSATGQLQVLRVVDGLGHGLDEAAIAAAREIRFKPARSEGRAVDQATTLRVVFRLA